MSREDPTNLELAERLQELSDMITACLNSEPGALTQEQVMREIMTRRIPVHTSRDCDVVFMLAARRLREADRGREG